MSVSFSAMPATSAIPVVLLILHGGKGTLGTVCHALEKSTPVVVIDGSGRAAKYIAVVSKLKL